MKLPLPRGPISAELFGVLPGPPGPLPSILGDLAAAAADTDAHDARLDNDVQISLFALYGLCYGTFDDVDQLWEWHPPLLALRAALEAAFERDALSEVDPPADLTSASLPGRLMDLASGGTNSLLPHFIHLESSLEQVCELVIHRSIDNLHEGDAHTWAIPRFMGRGKSALIEIQADEYGGGIPGRSHAELYYVLMDELGLDPAYGAHIEQIPAVSIALHNLKSFFGLHLRWRGALLGNLAVTEIGSSFTNRRYSEALKRLGATEKARWFYDEHILADAVHEQLAAHDMCGGFAETYPNETDRVYLGAQATLNLRRLFAQTVISAWSSDTSSLREPSRV